MEFIGQWWNSPYNGSAMQSFDVVFIVSQNTLLKKQSIFLGFQTPSRSCDVTEIR